MAQGLRAGCDGLVSGVLGTARDREDIHVRTRLRFSDILAAAVCLLALALMSVAAALPFLQIPIYGGLQTGGEATPQLVHSLIQGYDAGWVVVILLILGLAAASRLAGIRAGSAAVCCLALSTTALALGLFEASDGGSRVLTGGWGLPDTYGTSEHLTLDAGFYLYLGGAAVAVVTSLVIVVTSIRDRHANTHAPQPRRGARTISFGRPP